MDEKVRQILDAVLQVHTTQNVLAIQLVLANKKILRALHDQLAPGWSSQGAREAMEEAEDHLRYATDRYGEIADQLRKLHAEIMQPATTAA